MPYTSGWLGFGNAFDASAILCSGKYMVVESTCCARTYAGSRGRSTRLHVMAVGLQHLTRSLPWFVLQPAEALLGSHCYSSLVWDVNWTDTACLRLGLSKGLGLGIVVFGSLLKFPQMYKIVHARSAEGISLAMYILEVVAYTISLAYAIRLRIPFSTYGENASLTVQSMSYVLTQT